MKQEHKDLLLKYLCMALPYGVKIHCNEDIITTLRQIDEDCFCECWENEDFKCHSRWMLPYLRSMSSMTEEEVNEYNQCWEEDRDDIMIIGKHFEEMYKSKKFTLYMHPVVPMYRHILWLLENHFDFMGLIPKGLAIEVTESNNPYKD